VYNDSSKKAYFLNYEDYLNRSSDQVAILGAQKLAAMLYGLDSDFEKKLPENKFLVQYKFVNDKLQFIDQSGRLTDTDGRLVNEDGRYINDNGQFVDRDGNLVDEKGDYVVEFSPFTDDNGKPVLLEKDNDKNVQQSVQPTPSQVQAPTPVSTSSESTSST
jgi:hypothetical protein